MSTTYESHLELREAHGGRFVVIEYDKPIRHVRSHTAPLSWADAFESACRMACVERPFFCQGYRIDGLGSPEISKAQHAAWWHGVVSRAEAEAAFAPQPAVFFHARYAE